MSVPTLKQPFKSKVWYICWSESRRTKRVSTHTTEVEKAKTFFANWLLNEGSYLPRIGPAPVIADLWAIYMAQHLEKRAADPQSAMFSWQNLRIYFHALKATDIQQSTIDGYVNLRLVGKIGRVAKPQTCRKELLMLYACLNFCAERGKLDKSDIKHVELPDPGAPRERWLRSEEIDRLMAAATAERHPKARLTRAERFLWLALETAGRKTALVELKWSRVDFETGTIDLNDPDRRKTNKRRAIVPISDALLPILKRAYAEREKDNPYVLDYPGHVWGAVQRVARAAGFGEQTGATGVSPHVLRHTAATHMARRGVSLFKIAKVLGNSVAMIEKVYAKHCPRDLQAAVNSISGTGEQK